MLQLLAHQLTSLLSQLACRGFSCWKHMDGMRLPRIFVAGMAYGRGHNVTESEIRALFERHGTITGIKTGLSPLASIPPAALASPPSKHHRCVSQNLKVLPVPVCLQAQRTLCSSTMRLGRCARRRSET